MSNCTLCDIECTDLVWSGELVIAVRDRSPVSRGHTLVVTRRHIPTYFDATEAERHALWSAVDGLKRDLDASLSPDGYNIGFNVGTAAGQTTAHMHVHVIPRYEGDVADPRGGIRDVVPTEHLDEEEPGPRAFEGLPNFIPGEEEPLVAALRKALWEAHSVDILAAFIQLSGLDTIAADLVDALDQGKSVRILTGDYLNITHPHALQRLLNWTAHYDNLQARLYRTHNKVSFHPKAYVFTHGDDGVAFVGSSNLSRSALTDGIEWNLKTNSGDSSTFKNVRGRFDQLFESPHAEALSRGLVEGYRAQVIARPPPEQGEAPGEVFGPHKIQARVLEELGAARASGECKGLVVMATGLGKTYLSAFDFAAMGGRRALFVAHREEILQQAADTWAKIFPEHTVGLLVGDRKEPEAELLFASVQTLSRLRHLRQFDPSHFDYVVIDEFHHAASNSYRKLLEYFDPRFMLGLTATPDRTDRAPLLDLCDGNEICRVSLTEGIDSGLLVPFHYFGVKDDLDFKPIPWRCGRFEVEALTSAVSTRDRAKQALREYRRHAPATARCSLVFCCSRAHADFMARFLREHGVPAVSVHSGPTTAPRAQSLRRLRNGELEAICAVDVFNEGLDVPDINTILMLRPTESPIVFLQQLGRGLRRSKTTPKKALVVVDFIGNHRSFTVKPMALVSLTGREVQPGVALRLLREGLVLPEGCTVDIETEALDMLDRVTRLSSDDELLRLYATFVSRHGRRPSARELLEEGVHFKSVQERHGTWFDFVEGQGDLRPTEQHVLSEYREWFRDLQRVRMDESCSIVVIDVLLRCDELHGEMPVDIVSRRCLEVLRSDPVLRLELDRFHASGEGMEGFLRDWRRASLRTFDVARGLSRQWLKLDDDRLVSRLEVPQQERETFDAMTAELVEVRIAEHRLKIRRKNDRLSLPDGPIVMSVSSAGNKAILRPQGWWPDIRKGEAREVQVIVDEETVVFKLVKIAVNVAFRPPSRANILTELMQRWFGQTAGQRGRRDTVELIPQGDDPWILRPRSGRAEVIPMRRLPYFEDLRVACGAAESQFEGRERSVMLDVETARRVDPRHHFVVRASGGSMDGGLMPIRDGELVLVEAVTVAELGELEGRTVLVTGGRAEETLAYLKIPVKVGDAWVLRSASPLVPDILVEPDVSLRVVGRALEVVEESSRE